MSATRKPRGDSVLKTLPDARQAEIYEHGAGHTLAETVEWLRRDGIKTSSAALSEFLSWYSLREQLRRNQSTVSAMIEDLRKSAPQMSEEELFAAGQRFFSALALAQRDSLAWKRAQDARAKLETLRLLERRVKLLEAQSAKAEEAEAVAGDARLTKEEKEARIRAIFGV